MPGAIDAIAVAATPEVLAYTRASTIADFAGGGVTEAEMVDQMDAAGVEAAIIAATRAHVGRRYAVPIDVIKGIIDRHPGRFYGLVGVNIFEPESSLRDVVRAIDQCGFRGIHIYPHRMQVPPNAPAYDPFYAMARELDVPIVMQIGNCFRDLTADRSLMEAVQRHDLERVKPTRGWYCHPAYLDDVCRRFPEVRIVASHAGWPWTQELIDLMLVHPRLYADTSVYYPSVWEDILLDFIRGPGMQRVMWGTNYPEVQWGQALAELRALNLPGEVHDRLVRQNAVELYRLG